MSTLALPKSIAMETLAWSVRLEKQIKNIETGKEVKLDLTYRKRNLIYRKSKKFTKNYLRFLMSLAKVIEGKINMQKSAGFLNASSEQSENKVRKHFQ